PSGPPLLAWVPAGAFAATTLRQAFGGSFARHRKAGYCALRFAGPVAKPTRFRLRRAQSAVLPGAAFLGTDQTSIPWFSLTDFCPAQVSIWRRVFFVWNCEHRLALRLELADANVIAVERVPSAIARHDVSRYGAVGDAQRVMAAWIGRARTL